MLYPAIATLSFEACQVRSICELDARVAVRLSGVDGGWLSKLTEPVAELFDDTGSKLAPVLVAAAVTAYWFAGIAGMVPVKVIVRLEPEANVPVTVHVEEVLP